MAITRRTVYSNLLFGVAICVAIGVAVRFRYATEIVRVQNGRAAVEVTDNWTGSRKLCELYSTYPTDCQAEISFESPPHQEAASTAPKLTPKACKAIEARHEGTPTECVFQDPQGGQH